RASPAAAATRPPTYPPMPTPGVTPQKQGAPQSAKSAAGYLHVVDWCTVHQIRCEIRKAASSRGAEVLLAEGGPDTTAQELADWWLHVVQASRHDTVTVTDRDKEFVRIRVLQTMREVDPQGSGKVGVDVWCNHMLLTRSSPAAMRAMLHINRFLEGSVQSCPGILVSLQSAFEVAEGFQPPEPKLDFRQSMDLQDGDSDAPMPLHERDDSPELDLPISQVSDDFDLVRSLGVADKKMSPPGRPLRHPEPYLQGGFNSANGKNVAASDSTAATE
ncbi:unnamed protein product, partial [Polarella glacialis]